MQDELIELVEQLRRNRQVALAALAEIDESEAGRAGSEGEYSPRQVVAHLAGSCRSMMRVGQRMAAGEEPRVRPDFDLNYFNQRLQEKRAHMTLEVLLEEWGAAQDELIEWMKGLMPEELEKPGDHPLAKDINLRQLLGIIVDHEQEHLALMEESRSR
jgi:hypothetical protein